MSTKRYVAELHEIEHEVDGIPFTIRLRILLDRERGRVRAVRSVYVVTPEGYDIPRTNDGYIDDQELAVKVTPKDPTDTERAERLEKHINWQWHKTHRELEKELARLAAEQAAANSWPQGEQFYGLGIGDMLKDSHGQELGQVTAVEPVKRMPVLADSSPKFCLGCGGNKGFNTWVCRACQGAHAWVGWVNDWQDGKRDFPRAPTPSLPPPAPYVVSPQLKERAEKLLAAPPGKPHDFSNPYLVAHGGHLRCVDCGKPASSGLCVPDAGWRERWEIAISTSVNAQGLQPSPGEQTPQETQARPFQSHLLGQGAIGVWSLRAPK